MQNSFLGLDFAHLQDLQELRVFAHSILLAFMLQNTSNPQGGGLDSCSVAFRERLQHLIYFSQESQVPLSPEIQSNPSLLDIKLNEDISNLLAFIQVN